MHVLRFKTSAILVLLPQIIVASATGAVVTVLRGPYLQQGTPGSVIVRWRTDVAAESFLRCGTSPGNFSNVAANAAAATEHAVFVTGLQPETKYFYEIGDGTNWLAGTSNNYFITAPPHGTRRPTRIWSIGDGGEANPTSMSVRDAYAAFTGNRHTDVWLMLGDNAYPDGADADYQAAVFDLYPGLLAKTFLWPTVGNHDTHQSDAFGNFPYLEIFDLPTHGEAGGVPSGTERYYSFDYANIHFICLDSMTSGRGTNGPMSAWLISDLEATTQDWIIAYWHHPPYSHGTHDSDSEMELVEMRQNLVPILENHGVDLVLSGHSHSYERSYLIDGHYGLSSTFVPSMKKAPGDGREDGTGAYSKGGDPAGHEGAVYTVAGCAAMGGGASPHPAMFVSGGDPGSLVIDVAGDRLDLRFLTFNGAMGDHFTMIKTLLSPTNPPVAPSNFVVAAVSANRINISWEDAFADEAGFKIERSTNDMDFVQFLVVGAGVRNAADSGLAPSTRYTYRMRAYNVIGDSPYTAPVQAITFDPPLDTTPPAAVTNLAVINTTSNSVTLSWTAPGDEGAAGTVAAAGYDLRFSGAPIDNANFNSFPSVPGVPAPGAPGGAQFFTIAGLAPDSSYYFALKAYDEANNISPLSNVPDTRTLRPGAPLAPGSLMATATATNKINLTWIDNARNEGGFQIQRSVDGTNFAQALIVGANVTNVTDTGLAPARTYLYRVRATNTAGFSPFSNGAQATTLSLIDSGVTVLIASNAVWRYLDNGSDQGMAWRETGFVDSNWAFGPAPLGYGGGIEVTTVGFGPDANNKYFTTYFRHRFTSAGPAAFASLNIRLVRDDGAVVYLNNQEIFRSNMPTGAVTYVTKAAAGVNGADETTFFDSPSITPAWLIAGTNVAAVEIHQRSGGSSDIAFNLQLTAVNRPPPPRVNIVLQPGNQVVLHWNTSSGHIYRLQQTTELNGTAWNSLGADLIAAGASISVTHTLNNPGQRFFRVLLVD